MHEKLVWLLFILTWIHFCFVFSVSFFIWNSSLTCSEVSKLFLWMLQRDCMSVLLGAWGASPASCGYPSVFWYILERMFACPAVNKSTSFFPVVFPVREAFFMNSTLKDKLTGREKGTLMIQTFPVCLGQGGCSFPSGDLCSFKGKGFPPPTPVSFLTLLHVSLAPGVIPRSRTPMAMLGKRIWQVYSFFCC